MLVLVKLVQNHWSKWASCFLSPGVSPQPRYRLYSWGSLHHQSQDLSWELSHKKEAEMRGESIWPKYRQLWKGESPARTLVKLEHRVCPLPMGKKSIKGWLQKAEQKVFPKNERGGPMAGMLEGSLLVSFSHGNIRILRAAYLFLNISSYDKVLYFKLKPPLYSSAFWF